MRGLIYLIGLVLFSSVNSGNVVKQVSPKDFPLPPSPSRIQGRIVSGNRASLRQFPYQVSIRATSGTSTSICGGSIISTTFILTAAHCTKNYNSFEIGLGSNFLSSPLMRRTSTVKIEHPNYNANTLSNDIALIKLPMPLKFNLNVSPIQLPSKSQAGETFISSEVLVSGFGRTSDDSTQVSQNLNYVSMRVIPNLECSSIFGSKIVSGNVICARGRDGSDQNACLGDSGGPMALNESGMNIQVGIVSFVSSRGCKYGDPSGYTRVSKYLDWIALLTGIPLRP